MLQSNQSCVRPTLSCRQAFTHVLVVNQAIGLQPHDLLHELDAAQLDVRRPMVKSVEDCSLAAGHVLPGRGIGRIHDSIPDQRVNTALIASLYRCRICGASGGLGIERLMHCQPAHIGAVRDLRRSRFTYEWRKMIG